MLRIKRLYTFVIQTFLPVFMMTFVICLFILLMQFLWKYVEDLVGKGLDNSVIGELFFYAMLNLIPLGLPLAILLASLMAFGNMGERLELLSIKAAGVSLLKAMRPLIILIACISIGAFFFQNEAMPRISVKFKTLLSSIKHKSPELEIPEGSFYGGIKNYSIYVKKKDPETKLLHDVMIYDTSNGFNNMSVFVCDSARMRVSVGKDFLLLNLYDGQRFANFRDATINASSDSRYSQNSNKFIPYSRENFKEKSIIIPFDGNFDRMDESAMDNHQSGKNITMLSQSIDSMTTKLDSLNIIDRKVMKDNYLTYRKLEQPADTTRQQITKHILDFDSVMQSYEGENRARIFETAASDAERNSSNFIFQTMGKTELQRSIRYHEVEWHRKFTLSFACLIFFFIGAPLGAIIRKGGLGMPAVVSVLFFIVYYMLDTGGVKMARDGVWGIWPGMWLSSLVLFPIGVFLTYKAMNDSALFNSEAYSKFFRKLLRIKDPKKVLEANRKVTIVEIPSVSSLNIDSETLASFRKLDNNRLKEVVSDYKQYGYGQDMQILAVAILKERGEDIDSLIDNQDYEYKEAAFNLFCGTAILTTIGYIILPIFIWANIIGISNIIEISYIVLVIRALSYYFSFYDKITKKMAIYHTLITIALIAAFPFAYPLVRQKMAKDLHSEGRIAFS